MTPESTHYLAEGLAAYMRKGGPPSRWFESKDIAPADAEDIALEVLRLHSDEMGAALAELEVALERTLSHRARVRRRRKATGRYRQGFLDFDTEMKGLREEVRT